MTTSCPKKPNIAEISPHLICALCGGYLIDATTIVECLHSFCKTCIVRYLESSKYCPICEVLVHKTRPLQHIRLDHTLQDIVYKLVPGLFQTEMKRRREFYKDSPTVRSAKTRQEQQRHRVIYSADEKFSICLEFCPDGKLKKRTRSSRRSRSSSKESPDRRYFLCPASATVALIKKFIKLKFALPDNFKVDLFHSQGGLRDHFSLMDVAYIYSWRREGILQLYYSIYKEPDRVPKIEVTEVKEVVKQEDQEDNRPSSLFSKAKLLGNHSVDGSIPHNLSPLELIATVANDISIQEGRGLKRKTEEAQLYEQEEENSDEIQIQKSIEHAIDICSNNNLNNSLETSSAPVSLGPITPLYLHEHSKGISKASVSAAFTDAIQTSVAVYTNLKPALASNAAVSTYGHNIHLKPKLKEKPKTTDTASQCDPRPKKHRPDPSATTTSSQHSKNIGKPNKTETNVKPPKLDTHPKSTKSDTPVRSTKLDTPVKSSKSDTPVKSSKSDTPVKSSKADTPVRPSKVDTPVKSAKADASLKSSKTDTPVKSLKTDTVKSPKGDTPVKSSKTDVPPKPDKAGKTDKLAKLDATLKQEKLTKSDKPTKYDVLKQDKQTNKDKQTKAESFLKADRLIKPDKVTNVVSAFKEDAYHSTDKTKSKEETVVKSDKLKANGNNHVDLAHPGTAVKPPDKVIKDNNANQTTILSGKQLHEQKDKTVYPLPINKAIAKSETTTSITQINGFKTVSDTNKSQQNHTSVKTKQVEGKD